MALHIRPLSSQPIALPDRLDVDVLVLPREVKDGIGLYHDSVITFAKELREEGATAAYLHDPAHREWIGEKGLPLVVTGLALAYGGAAGWDATKAILRRAKGTLRARIARRKRPNDGAWEWFELEGTGDEVADGLEQLEGGGEVPESVAEPIDTPSESASNGTDDDAGEGT